MPKLHNTGAKPAPNPPGVLSRRSFLARTAATGAAIVVPAAARAAPTREENPDLLDRATEFRELLAAISDSDREKEAAIATYRALAPLVPDEAIVQRRDPEFLKGEPECDVFGKVVWPPAPGSAPRRIASVDELQRHVERCGDTKAGQRARRRLVIVRRYHDQVAHAERESDIDEAFHRRQRLGLDLSVVATELMLADAWTRTGIEIKAHAAKAAIALTSREDRYMLQAGNWMIALVDDIIRIEGHKLGAVI